jgi:hypothetical protein
VKALGVFLLLLLVALLQVGAAPLFPLSAAEPDLVLVCLAWLLAFAGPRSAMLGLPLLAVCVGFLSDRSPALLLFAYLPLLPLSLWLEQANAPIGGFGRFAVSGLATGFGARLLLASAAMLGAASLAIGPLIFSLLLPGLVLDLLFLLLAYVPMRIAGWEPQGMSLRRRGWVTI